MEADIYKDTKWIVWYKQQRQPVGWSTTLFQILDGLLDINSSQTLYTNDFGDRLTFPPVPQAAIGWISRKYGHFLTCIVCKMSQGTNQQPETTRYSIYSQNL